MANNFPSQPSGLALASLNYVVKFAPLSGLPPVSPFAFTGVATALVTQFAAGQWGINFDFTVPGQTGSFDQDAVEAGMKVWLELVAQALAAILGVTQAQASAGITVTRIWTWQDDSASNVSSMSESWPWTA